MRSNDGGGGGVGILGILGTVFVCAKIFGWEPVASWSWWWVTAPFWGGIAVLLVVLAALGLLSYAVDRRSARRGRRS